MNRLSGAAPVFWNLPVREPAAPTPKAPRLPESLERAGTGSRQSAVGPVWRGTIPTPPGHTGLGGGNSRIFRGVTTLRFVPPAGEGSRGWRPTSWDSGHRRQAPSAPTLALHTSVPPSHTKLLGPPPPASLVRLEYSGRPQEKGARPQPHPTRRGGHFSARTREEGDLKPARLQAGGGLQPGHNKGHLQACSRGCLLLGRAKPVWPHLREAHRVCRTEDSMTHDALRAQEGVWLRGQNWSPPDRPV